MDFSNVSDENQCFSIFNILAKHAQVSWDYTGLFQTGASIKAQLHAASGVLPNKLKIHKTFL